MKARFQLSANIRAHTTRAKNKAQQCACATGCNVTLPLMQRANVAERYYLGLAKIFYKMG